MSFIHAYWLYALLFCSRNILIAQPFIHELLYPCDIRSFTDSNMLDPHNFVIFSLVISVVQTKHNL